MTNLSKELCEICGIKPQIVEDYELNEYEIYPNFEQPENFVRLGNKKLKYDNYTTIFYTVNYLSDNSWSNSSEFLISLLHILKDEYSYSYYNNLKELIKFKIRETEWIYE